MQQNVYWDGVAYEKNFKSTINMDLFSQYVYVNSRILDIGCGYGRTLHMLCENGYTNLHGIDFSAKMIERAHSLYPELDVREAQAWATGYEAESFDVVLLLSVLTCISQNDEQKKVFTEIDRILKPGGTLYINDFLIGDDSRNQQRYNKYYPQYENFGVFELNEGAVLRHHTESWIKSCLTDYQEISYETFLKTTMNGNQAKGFRYLGVKR